jgi:hypothetical protein
MYSVQRSRTYSHLWPDSDDSTRTAVDSVLSADSCELGR